MRVNLYDQRVGQMWTELNLKKFDREIVILYFLSIAFSSNTKIANHDYMWFSVLCIVYTAESLMANIF